MKTTLQFTALTMLCLLLNYSLQAQTNQVSGKIIDATNNTTLIGVTVILMPVKDTTAKTGTSTDENGNFQLDNISTGSYLLKTSYLGYNTLTKMVNVTGTINIGTITLKPSANMLGNVTVEGKQIRAQQIGDTTQFNADAYKTHPDATAEDLVTKMPGVTSDNNGVKVNGETVQQVYIDGKPFFGTDPTLALKNLPSEVIDKVQVFDKLSDQSQFTGFDDGNAQKTINIITKKNKSNGQFGKIYGGYGTDDRYLAGGSLNLFNGNRRISIIELSNNVNQQNFSSQDILGITGSNQSRGGNGGGGSRGSFGGGSGGGGNNNFLVGQQGGISTTHSAGINYSDNWGSKIKVTGSYFFNSTDNINNTFLTRNYFGDSLLYSEKDYSESKNTNHRANFRFEYTIDSFNSLIITPNVSFQHNSTSSTQFDTSNNPKENALLSFANNRNTATNNGYSFSNNILFQHKFHKPRRTISLNINTSMNEKSGSGSYLNNNERLSRIDTPVFRIDTIFSLLNQNYTMYNNGYTIAPNINYTEPIGKKGQLMVNYAPSYTKNIADKETYDYNDSVRNYTNFNPLLSNKYNNTYFVNKGGINYRLGDKKINFMAGVNVQNSTLDGDQRFPYDTTTTRNFFNVLPQAMLNIKFNSGTNLRIMYRTNTTAPSIAQLQNVVDVSNSLLLKTGNSALKQDFEQTLIVRYGLTKPASGHNFFVFLYANYIDDYIGNITLIPTRDSVFSKDIIIPRGSQLTLPTNLNGYISTRTFITYGLPIDVLKSNLNLNGGVNYTRTPGIINNTLNYSNNTAASGGIVLGSNISENLDFTLSYSGSYNIVSNTSTTNSSNNNYYNHTASFKVNWIFLKGIVLNTNITNTFYSTFTNTTGNENYLMWNAYIGYKFLKNKALEARISAFDLLQQNKSVNRTVADNYIENSVTQVLQQYFMFTLTYTLRNFKGTTLPSDLAPNPNAPERPYMNNAPPREGGMPHY